MVPHRKLVVQEFVSLDGFAAGPNDDVAFIPASMQGDRSFGQEQVSFMDECDTMLLGRITYNMFSRYWPNVKQGDEQPFADKFNGLSKIVFSTILDRAPWGPWSDARVVTRSPAEEVDDLKRRPGKGIFVSGSISVVQMLTRANLVDEFRLVLCPVTLGTGRRLFDDGSHLRMTTTDVRQLDRGAVSLRYSLSR